MLEISSDVLSALQLLRQDQNCERVFNFIRNGPKGASGWEIAKSLNQDPSQITMALDNLKRLNIVNSSGSGMDGYYFLTDLGFQLRESLPT